MRICGTFSRIHPQPAMPPPACTVRCVADAGVLLALILLTLFSLLHHHISTGGPHIVFGEGDGGSVDIAHVYVLAPAVLAPEARRRRKSYQKHLAGVPYTEVSPDMSLVPNCTGAGKHLFCTAGHMAILAKIAANTTAPRGSFHVIFEDDMCPSPRVGSSHRMLRAIGMALARAAGDALAVNLGACTGRRVLEQARAALLDADCQVLEGFGPCTHAWATTPEHAGRLLGILRAGACSLPVDTIMTQDARRNRYQHVFCPGPADAALAFSGNMVRQCGGASIIHGG